MRREVLRFEHVTYKEKDKVLLQDFDLNIFEGEIMGLLTIGANGLPALLKILSEYPPLYHGYIYYRERMVDSWVEGHHAVPRISVIGDTSSLVEGQSVLTNIMILRRGFSQEFLNFKLLNRQLAPFLKEAGVSINPALPVEKLTAFERIVVEILRGVVADHRLIVVQEISTIINDSQLHRLYEIMRYYAKKGFSFLYICPHFEEQIQICDCVALMMHRRITKILPGVEMSKEVVNRCSEEYILRVQKRLSQPRKKDGAVVFSVEGLTGNYLKGLDCMIREGECVAIQCLDQKISRELFQVLLGKEEPAAGKYFLLGKPVKINSRSIAVIMEHPWETMIYPDMSVLDNLCICMDHRVANVWRAGNIRKSIRGMIEEQMGPGISGKRMWELSDMEKSELVYTRVLLQKPKIVFCIQPFKGEDLSHRLLIWDMQKRLLDRGIAVVILAVNMADALSLADRVIRIDKNTKVEEYERKDFHRLPPTVPWYFMYQEDGLWGEG